MLHRVRPGGGCLQVVVVAHAVVCMYGVGVQSA